MTEYHFTYKCRLCGKGFSEGITGTHSNATKILLSVLLDLPYPLPVGIKPPMTTIHNCEGYTDNVSESELGVADLIGVRRFD